MQLLQPRYDVMVFGRKDSVKRLPGISADLLIVCHSVPIHAAALIIELAANDRVVKQILWLSAWNTIPGLVVSGQSVIQIDSRKQPWLVAVEKAMKKIKRQDRELTPLPAATVSQESRADTHSNQQQALDDAVNPMGRVISISSMKSVSASWSSGGRGYRDAEFSETQQLRC
jgi:hypothetical protein